MVHRSWWNQQKIEDVSRENAFLLFFIVSWSTTSHPKDDERSQLWKIFFLITIFRLCVIKNGDRMSKNSFHELCYYPFITWGRRKMVQRRRYFLSELFFWLIHLCHLRDRNWLTTWEVTCFSMWADLTRCTLKEVRFLTKFNKIIFFLRFCSFSFSCTLCHFWFSQRVCSTIFLHIHNERGWESIFFSAVVVWPISMCPVRI